MDNSDINSIILENTSSGGAEVIDLSKDKLGFYIRDTGFEKFLSAIKDIGPLPNVRYISLAGGDIRDVSISRLIGASNQFPNLTAIDLENNHVGGKDQSSAAQILNNFSGLTKLYLSQNPTVLEGNILLAQAAANHPNIIVIELFENELDSTTKSQINAVTLGHKFQALELLQKARNNNGVLTLEDYQEFGQRLSSIIAASEDDLVRPEKWHVQMGKTIKMVSDNAAKQGVHIQVPDYYQKYVNMAAETITLVSSPASISTPQLQPVSPITLTAQAPDNQAAIAPIQVSASR